MCRDAGIQHILTAVATSRANEQDERYNATITAGLAALTTDNDWDEELRKVQFALNNTVNRVTRSDSENRHLRSGPGRPCGFASRSPRVDPGRTTAPKRIF
ncbi:hypothetical protein ILUMI_19060 [Ignelater luminosus]|uniref:Uncharacterized protein n=1 Tax=Ignelater luminosus TaxID=2038154 RepID=A0A8K0G688_IGNLU|nr:hypothetical protein ILUMI_19060 [Ignelater luminosus]